MSTIIYLFTRLYPTYLIDPNSQLRGFSCVSFFFTSSWDATRLTLQSATHHPAVPSVFFIEVRSFCFFFLFLFLKICSADSGTRINASSLKKTWLLLELIESRNLVRLTTPRVVMDHSNSFASQSEIFLPTGGRRLLFTWLCFTYLWEPSHNDTIRDFDTTYTQLTKFKQFFCAKRKPN